jgi:hypothetical protein
VEGEAEEPLLAAGLDRVAEVEEGAREEGAVLDDPEGAAALDDEESLGVARRRHGEDRRVEPVRELDEAQCREPARGRSAVEPGGRHSAPRSAGAGSLVRGSAAEVDAGRSRAGQGGDDRDDRTAEPPGLPAAERSVRHVPIMSTPLLHGRPR